MKIEKLTENKIRVIIGLDDLRKNNTDIHSLFTKAINSQGLFFDILKRAEKEVDFNTEGCRLLIEAFSSSDDILVFTITKYHPEDLKASTDEIKKKKLIAKRKTFNVQNKQAIYAFENFDNFCNFCCSINSIKKLDIKKLSKNTVLYLYNNTYYLVLKNINTDYENINMFYSTISEFAKLSSFSSNFSNKLFEHGNTIIKKDAINIGIRYFDVK